MQNRNQSEASNEDDLKIVIAENDEGRSSASLLINTLYSARGYACTHKIEDIANQITLCASLKGSVIGTITLGIDSHKGMLADQVFRDQINLFRDNGAKVCEITKLALDRTGSSQRALAEMFHTLYIYARYLYRRTHFFIEVNPRHQRFYETVLGFKSQCELRLNDRVKAPACLLWLDLDELTKKIASFRRNKKLNDSKRSFFSYWFSPEVEASIVARVRAERACNSMRELNIRACI